MIEITKTKNVVEILQALVFLENLKQYYPKFQSWYINSAMPGIVQGNDFLLQAKQEGQLIGIALGKRSRKESKLRCVRIHPDYQNNGLGVRLIDKAIDVLQCEQPHCTVAQEIVHDYSRLFVNRYGFKLEAVEKGLYRPGKLEYVFNL
jgi:ribosomal protein S18 acetylase RimI-like enzyme